MKIILIEDDQQTTEYIKMAFAVASSEFQVISTSFGELGLALSESEAPDLILLDLGLPDLDGFEILKQIRLFSDMPVVIMTVRNEEADIVKGLQLGADDYLVKPFGQMELLARINALMRRFHYVQTLPYYFSKDIQFSESLQRIFYFGRTINLTRTEGIILHTLLKNANKVVTHHSLAITIWGDDFPCASKTLKVYIRRLRQKLEPNPHHPKLILNSRGLGYLIKKQEK